MQYIAFDFETSGLPEGRRPVTPETLRQFDTCRAVSLSAARFSNHGRLVDTFDAIIYPDNFVISQGSIDIHGITNEQARKEGRPFPEVFVDFLKFVGPRSKNFVAHNAQFDTSVLRSEMIRHDIDLKLIEDFNIQCTLKMYKERFMKPIKLGHLYKEIFGEDFENAHNSLADCIACGRVYPYLLGHERKLKPIGVPKVILGASSVAFYKVMPFDMEIGQSFIAAILTVVGYSLNDTVVIFDRIREFAGIHTGWKYKDVVDSALSSTLGRTINTSLTTLLVMLAIFLFGGDSIKGFMFALIVGVAVGTYSSLFVATPIMYDTTKKSVKGKK